MKITSDNKHYRFSNAGIALTQDQYIKRLKTLHDKENLLFDKVNYTSLANMITLTCKEHGDFDIKAVKGISESSRKVLCKACYLKYYKASLFINNARLIHGNKFDYSKINYNGSKSECSNILCNNHKIYFGCVPDTHLNNSITGGCIECKRDNNKQKFLSTVKNNINYDYSKINYIDDNTPISIKCLIHNALFEQPPKYHITKYGICPLCINDEKIKSFIKKAIKVHGNIYDYSLIKDYKSDEKVPIQCKDHGVFYQLPLSHLSCKNACPACSMLFGDNIEKFIDKAKEIHGDMYDYSQIKYLNSKVNIQIVCKVHGSFFQNPYNHVLQKQGCPKCGGSSNTSKAEIEWLNSLRVPIRSYIIEGYNVDGYNEETKTVYEFLGDYRHGNLKVFDKADYNKSSKQTFGELNTKTFNRLNFLKSKGYNVIYIRESDRINKTNYTILL